MVACGGAAPPPPRGVVERDIDAWRFRRYQQLVDVELWVQNNKAIAYTASYVRDSAERSGNINAGDVVNAFVTQYEQKAGVLRALVEFVRRLAQESKYTVDERSISGVRVLTVSGYEEEWVLWASDRYVVKIGGRNISAVPDALIETYSERYPSRLTSGILDGPLPEDSPPAGNRPEDPDDPAYNPDNPTPDWQQYKSGTLDKKPSDETKE